MAAESVGQLTGQFSRSMPWRSTGRDEQPPTGSGIPVMLVHGLADRASIVSPLQRELRGCGVGSLALASYNVLTPDIRTAARDVLDLAGDADLHVDHGPWLRGFWGY
ncbi:hypothetical protein ABZ474_32765, partial [Streptomyces mirabilis]